MPRFKMVFDDIATGAVADTFKTLASLIVADTTGHRCRLRSLAVGPADNSPGDANVAIQVQRIADVSAGTAGTKTAVSAANIAKTDPGSVDSLVSGGRDYSAEPTTYETEPLWQMDINTRGGFIKEWAEEDAPIATQDMLLGILAAPRAAAAVNLSGAIEFDVF